MKAVILYDSKTSGGSTEAIIDTIGLKLAESGAYVEKVKCKALADYSFIREFDLVILGAPVYYFLVASQLLGALNYGNLKKNLKRKKIAMFLSCGSPEAMAAVLYLPQLKIHLISNKSMPRIWDIRKLRLKCFSLPGMKWAEPDVFCLSL